MSDLIRREDAVGPIERKLDESVAAYIKAVVDGFPDAGLGDMRRSAVLREVLTVLRALPGIGTCKDCAEWLQYPFDEIERGSCGSVEMDCDDRPWTKPDFYCAAWKAKEPQA